MFGGDGPDAVIEGNFVILFNDSAHSASRKCDMHATLFQEVCLLTI